MNVFTRKQRRKLLIALEASALSMVLLLSGCASRRYQVVLMGQEGRIVRLEPQSRDDADKKALAINAGSQGQVVAWVQKFQHFDRPPAIAVLPVEKEK